MNARDLYLVFADPLRPWSPWVKPILFADIAQEAPQPAAIPPWAGPAFDNTMAWVIDLPGIEGFSAACAACRSAVAPGRAASTTAGWYSRRTFPRTASCAGRASAPCAC